MAEPVEVIFEEEGSGSLSAALDAITASANEASAAMGEVSTSADEVSSSGDELTSSSDDVASATDGVSTSAGAATVATGALAAAAAAAAAAYLAWTEVIVPFANELERQLGILNRTEGSVRAASEAVGGMVSGLDLTIARNRMLQAGLRMSNDDFAAFAETAFDFAAATGGDATAAMQQLSMALITGRETGLARFGIALDTTQTQAEQFAGALEQMRVKSESMESGADTLGGQIGRLDVMIEDATTEMFRGFDATEGLSTAFDALSEEVNTSAAALGLELPTAMEAARGAGIILASALEVIVVKVTEVIQSLRLFVESLAELDFGGAADAMEQFVSGANTFDLLARTIETTTENWDAAMAGANETAGDLTTGLTNLGGAQRGAARATEDHAAALRALAEAMLQTTTTLEEDIAAEEARLLDERSANLTRFVMAREELERASAERRRSEMEREEEKQAEAQLRLVESAQAASTDFASAWEGGINSVISALERAQEAAAEAGTEMISSMDAAAAGAMAAANQMGDALLGGIANSFAAAAKAAIKGEQSFGDALAGMLEDTLFSIGTQAIVLSVFEFAKAIADAASLNAPGAAAHAAAGVAFAAVGALAFAGGAGLAAANPAAPAASAPASPEGTGGDTTTGGGDITVIFSGAIVTAGTRADVGREIEDLIGASQRRYGRAA